MGIQKTLFGKTKEGKEVYIYTLINKNGVTVKITNYGGIVTSLTIPDKNGNNVETVLGFDNLDSYLSGHPYFGALIGRYGNRIANGKFSLNGKEYILAKNDGEHHLHGGITGFDKVLWKSGEIKEKDGEGIELSYLSKDGEEGYPGNLSCLVKYLLTDKNELIINYEAKTDKPTVVNLTHHSYFNLAGAGNGNILKHEIMLAADKYTIVGEGLIPTGEIGSVKGTPLDFTEPHSIGERINKVPGGYDHNYVLRKSGSDSGLAAIVKEPVSGRVLEVYTTEPGIQFYSGNFLTGEFKGKDNKPFVKYGGFCLEAQHYPDSPNHPNFDTTILNPGKVYKQTTIYKFIS